MKLFSTIIKSIYHFFTARNTGGFGVHSPFVYQFIQSVLKEKHYFYVFTQIESLRKKEFANNTEINITDFGTGKDRKSNIRTITRNSVKSRKWGQLLFRMVHYFKSIQVLELGTSLGITTSYLASSSSQIKCISLEGCPQIAEHAKLNFEKLNLTNIKLVVGNIDNTLPHILQGTEKLDFVFFDANHTYEAVLHYFDLCLTKAHDETIMVFDDIHSSKEMELAWKGLIQHPRITSTIDLFQMGIVFFNSNLTKKHYKISY